MTQSDGSALGVQLVLWNAQFFNRVSSLRGKGFIDLPNVNIANFQSCFLEQIWNSDSWSDSHDFWWATLDSILNELRQNWKAEFFCNWSSGQNYCSGSVSNLRAVTGSGCSVLSESWLQFAQAFHGGFLSDTIIFGHCDLFALSILIQNCGFDWYNFAIEQARLLSFVGFSVAFNGHLVLLFSADTVFLGDILRSLSHTHETSSGLFMLENSFWNFLYVNGWVHVVLRHAFNTRSNTNVNNAHFDFGSNGGAWLQTWWAKSVNNHDWCGIRESGQELGHSGSDFTSSWL